jgi:predicted O-methyltransferase YrrM
VKRLAMAIKGFLAEEEGMLLYDLARAASTLGPVVEIGSYCGKSALFLGEGCREVGEHPLFTVDHHRGNEEQLPGGRYHDAELWDPDAGATTTLTHLVANIHAAGLDDWVIPMVGPSGVVGRHWGRRLGLVFIDGGHSAADVATDVGMWAPRLRRGGYLCMHDVYPDPADGGQAPFHAFERARRERRWRFVDLVGSLGVLRRT